MLRLLALDSRENRSSSEHSSTNDEGTRAHTIFWMLDISGLQVLSNSNWLTHSPSAANTA